ncbi:hypothetical protein DFA_02817 [Cavenderia fasciculata]|uniref:Uncharacterized protein n=1 Tax=Cavenderia fasciculata TaxID=261658 RepID=F4PIJ4_CACFS|nr:uncharacterized protein DFA_02817 [Cavenderia fasciculata]EGG24574.1 hypothetical protein DFA_02817 [Cavenderia fasciculata]|eukprot:XP_004362425.1 hypothetical protein DFA_02817 [Cavenderia fasciculata]
MNIIPTSFPSRDNNIRVVEQSINSMTTPPVKVQLELTTSQSVELDPAFNGILLGADQTVGDDSYCETDPYPKWKIIMIVDLLPMPSLEWQGSGTVITTVTISTEQSINSFFTCWITPASDKWLMSLIERNCVF